jgi:RimJ/RimL family protein N-acetyltransferase
MWVQLPRRLNVQPVLLDHPLLRLEPLSAEHIPGLRKQYDPTLWQWFAGTQPRGESQAEFEAYVQHRNSLDNVVSFAMVLPATGEAVGHSSFMEIRPAELRLEIGSTWIGRAYQGTFVNPVAKLLMLRHAFETLECCRVEIKTDERNLQSRAAILKLGAQFEGVLRRYQVMNDGFVRNTYMFSITADEWPTVKSGLLERIEAYQR